MDKQAGRDIEERFKPWGNPTVVFADAQGKEIDRTVGYSGDPEAYKKRLEKIIRGENTFVSLAAAYEKDSSDLPVLFELAKKYSAMGKGEKAQDLHRSVLEEYPEKAKKTTVPYAADKQVNAYELAKYMVGADLFRTRDAALLQSYVEEFPDGDFTENAYIMLGNYTMFFSGKDDGAAFFREVIKKYPKSNNLLSMYVMFCQRHKINLEEALDIANKVVKNIQTVYGDPYNNRAGIADLMEDSVKLESYYGAGFLEGRLSAMARELTNYSTFWMNKNENMESALKAAKFSLSLSSADVYQRFRLAGSFAKTGDIDGALEIFGPEEIEKYLDNPNDAMLYLRFWADQGTNLEHAAEIGEKLFKENPENFHIGQSLAYLYLKSGNEEKALNIYGPDMIQQYWDNANMLNTYAWFWVKQDKNLEHALKASKESIKLEEENHYYLDTAALILKKQGKLKEAVGYQEKAVSLDPNNKEYKDRLAEMKAELKK